MNMCSQCGRCRGYHMFEPLMLMPAIEIPTCFTSSSSKWYDCDDFQSYGYDPNKEESLDDIIDVIMDELKLMRRELARLHRRQNKERKEAGLPPIKPKKRRRK